jgi:hypothetical protein
LIKKHDRISKPATRFALNLSTSWQVMQLKEKPHYVWLKAVLPKMHCEYRLISSVDNGVLPCTIAM